MLDNFEANLERKNDFLFLVLYIVFGYIHRRIKDPNLRKWTSTLFGMFIMLCVFGEHKWHYIMCIFINILILNNTDKRYVHIIVTVFSISYLSVFKWIYFEECQNIYLTISIEQMHYVARIIGLGFDLHYSRKSNKSTKESVVENDDYKTEPSCMDIFHFSFCYLGTISGFFYRYRTYDDFINMPFARNSKHFKESASRAWKFVLCLGSYLVVHGVYWPHKYTMTSEFENSSVWYKIIYSNIQIQAFYLWMCSSFLLSEIICICAGFGAYPVQGCNECGHGPSKNYKSLRTMSDEECKKQTYDFKTVQSVDLYCALAAPWLSEFIRGWNMTFQYWLTNILYKNLCTQLEMKNLAMMLTLVFSGLWHGIHVGFQFTAVLITLFVISSRNYWKLSLNLNGWKLKIFLIVFFFIRIFFIGYFNMPFLLYDLNSVLKFYENVNYLPFMLHGIYHVIGVCLLSYFGSKKTKLK